MSDNGVKAWARPALTVTTDRTKPDHTEPPGKKASGGGGMTIASKVGPHALPRAKAVEVWEDAVRPFPVEAGWPVPSAMRVRNIMVKERAMEMGGRLPPPSPLPMAAAIELRRFPIPPNAYTGCGNMADYAEALVKLGELRARSRAASQLPTSAPDDGESPLGVYRACLSQSLRNTATAFTLPMLVSQALRTPAPFTPLPSALLLAHLIQSRPETFVTPANYSPVISATCKYGPFIPGFLLQGLFTQWAADPTSRSGQVAALTQGTWKALGQHLPQPLKGHWMSLPINFMLARALTQLGSSTVGEFGSKGYQLWASDGKLVRNKSGEGQTAPRDANVYLFAISSFILASAFAHPEVATEVVKRFGLPVASALFATTLVVPAIATAAYAAQPRQPQAAQQPSSSGPTITVMPDDTPATPETSPTSAALSTVDTPPDIAAKKPEPSAT